MSNTDLTIVAALVAVLAVLGCLMLTQRRRRHLRERFGDEYEHTVEVHGSARAAERELIERNEGFVEAWRAAQARFVDSRLRPSPTWTGS